MDGAQLPLKKQNKKKEVRGKKPQQEVDPDSQSAAALHGGPCGSSGILNVSVGERGQKGEGGGEEKWGWFSWEWSQNQNQKQPVQRRTGGFHFHIILKFLRHFFRQIKPRGQEAACVNKLVLNKHTNTQIHKNDFPPGRSLQGTAIHATAPPAWPEINHAAFGWMLFKVKWKNVHFSWKPDGFFVSLAAEFGCSGPVGYWPENHDELLTLHQKHPAAQQPNQKIIGWKIMFSGSNLRLREPSHRLTVLSCPNLLTKQGFYFFLENGRLSWIFWKCVSFAAETKP